MAQWLTAVIAGAAAIYARKQVAEARETRERVAQPDVVAYIEQDPRNWHYMDLVIKNFGQTAAYNIRLSLPPLEVVPYVNESTGEDVGHLYVPDQIAVLAPGQEWRTSWDSGIERAKYEGDLKTHFVGSVEFDSQLQPKKAPYRNPIVLDTHMFLNTLRVETKSARSQEKALYEIAATLKGYTKQHDGIWVYNVAGADERQYYKDLAAAVKAAHHRTVQALTEQRDNPGGNDSDQPSESAE